RNGNRSVYESAYFSRRSMLTTFTMAELLEREGRFTDRIIDGMWHIMEESTWILPAHNWSGKPVGGGVVSLPDTFSSGEDGDDMKHIDLFSAGTGGQMACLWYLTADLLDRENPVIRRRLLSQLRQRILHPFYTYWHDWWMGADEKQVLNNWTPWIISNVLTVIAFCEDDLRMRRTGVEKALVILDRYINHFPDDGGCDEGPGYWNVAGASYFDCLELLSHMSDGKIDVFDEPIVRRMCEYIMQVSISGDCYINFADAPSLVHPDFRMIARMGRKLSSPALSAFASTIVYRPETCPLSDPESYRFYLNLQESIPALVVFRPDHVTFYPDLQIMITREENGMFLAFKGGTNGESHNHNDVGQFILFDNGTPIIIDAGVEKYCRDTFSEKRYTLWAMRGRYHNIPEINGREQQPGGHYHAETKAYDKDSGKMTLELKHAYPADTGILSYQRSAELTDGTVCITDELHLLAPGSAAFHYLTTDEPSIIDHTIAFRSGHKAIFDASLSASVDAVALGDGKIAHEWKREQLYRITLETKSNITDAVYTLLITR
ncbi:MAG: heparinase II/III family protein, partial [Eubacteriales bacterium]